MSLHCCVPVGFGGSLAVTSGVYMEPYDLIRWFASQSSIFSILNSNLAAQTVY